MSATDRNQYKVQLDIGTVNEGVSATLMDLFRELKIGKLYSILLGMIYLFINILFTLCLKLIYTKLKINYLKGRNSCGTIKMQN